MMALPNDRRDRIFLLHDTAPTPPCRLSLMGSSGCLLDAAGATFDDTVQRRIWAAARDAAMVDGVIETVPGMNNLLVVFDPLRLRPAAVHAALLAIWQAAQPAVIAGRLFTIPVVYGGAGGEDIADLARHAGLPVDEVMRRHAAAAYTVAAIGSMPGFPYLSGLDPKLACKRRASPRARVAKGAVIIGGAQAGVMPVTAPSGWHIIGQTTTTLFDPGSADPVLLRPGDTVRFTVEGIEA